MKSYKTIIIALLTVSLINSSCAGNSFLSSGCNNVEADEPRRDRNEYYDNRPNLNGTWQWKAEKRLANGVNERSIRGSEILTVEIFQEVTQLKVFGLIDRDPENVVEGYMYYVKDENAWYILLSDIFDEDQGTTRMGIHLKYHRETGVIEYANGNVQGTENVTMEGEENCMWKSGQNEVTVEYSVVATLIKYR